MSDIQVAGELVSQSCSFERSALIIKRTLNWEECRILANMLGAMQVSMAFWSGDLMNYSEGLFGEDYTELFKDWAPHTLANWKWVARQVPLSRRRDALSWSHHAEVAGLSPEEQERWLEMAEAEKWTRADLRRALMPDRATPPIEDESPATTRLGGKKAEFETITCPFCGQSWETGG